MPVPQLTVEGRVVGDVMFRYTDEGLPVARFRMVAADRRQGSDGQWQDTERFWVTVTCFRKLAENVFESIRDRDAVVVVGKLSTSEWTGEDGSTKSTNKFIASSVGPSLFFLPRPAAGEQQPQQRRQQPAREQYRPSRSEMPARADDVDAWAPSGDEPWTKSLSPIPSEDPWA